MVRHNNPSISLDASRILNLKAEGFDSELVPFTPVIPITPRADIVKSFTQGTSGSITIYATPTGKQFYLTSLQLWFQKDATNDCTAIGISATVQGASVNLMSQRCLTTTATAHGITLSFPVPVLIDEGTNITCFGTFTVGSLARSGSLTGYTIEVSKP